MKKSSFRKTLLLIILLFTFLSVNSLVFPQETRPFLGTWKGAIDVMGQEMEIIVKLSLDEKKRFREPLMSPCSQALWMFLSHPLLSKGKKYLL